MKILLIHFSSVFGGVERHALDLARALIQNGHSIHLLTGPNSHDYSNEAFTVTILPNSKLFSPKNHLILFKIIQGWQPNIIHTHLYPSTRFAAFSRIWFPHIPLIETMHIDEDWRAGISKLFNYADGVYSHFFVQKFIAVSDSVKKCNTRNKFISPSKVHTIYNGIPANDSVNLPQTKHRIQFGFFGRFEEHKGINELLEALQKIPCQNLFEFHFAGSGRLDDKIRNFCSQNTFCHFHGFIKKPENFYQKIDCLVLPSHFEGFPLVLLEAGHYQKSVIASSVSGIPEIIEHGQTGLLIPTKNVESLILAMQQMINNPGLHQSLAFKHKEKVHTHFSFETMLTKTIQTYEVLHENFSHL